MAEDHTEHTEQTDHQIPLMGSIYSEIEEERTRQDEKWGGPAHDDSHSPGDWRWLVGQRMGRAYTEYAQGAIAAHRKRLIEAAALVVAALESFDRHAEGKAAASIPNGSEEHHHGG
jgi:hypothetical protein